MFFDLSLAGPVGGEQSFHFPDRGVANAQGQMTALIAGGSGRGFQFQPGLYRPYIARWGQRELPTVMANIGRTTLNKGEQVGIKEPVRVSDMVNNHGIFLPVWNTTLLRKEEWIELDKVVLKPARYRLKLWADLMAKVPYGGFNGMSKSVLEHENMSDPGEALVDMDGLSPGRNDAPQFGGQGLPLPITHCDFWMSSRKLAESRNGNTPLDTSMGEAAGRRVAETVEKTAIGVRTGISWGGLNTALTYTNTPSVYGLINFPQRLTYTSMNVPSTAASSSWTPEKTMQDVNECIQRLRLNKFYGGDGGFMIYHSDDWDPYLNGDYYVAKTSGAVAPTKTLRSRLLEIDGVAGIQRLDFLFATQRDTDNGPGADVDVTLKTFRMIFVQLTPDVIRAVNGLDITTLQWETQGGMRLNFKVMTIQVPQIRADQFGNCGVLDATNS